MDGFEAVHGYAPSPPQVQLRQYRDLDRGEMRRFCCDTGFIANPIDDIYQDRGLFEKRRSRGLLCGKIGFINIWEGELL